MKVPCLLREDPMAFLAPTNPPRIKCEKIQLSNSFESILDADVRYSHAVENISVGETLNTFKVFVIFVCFFISPYQNKKVLSPFYHKNHF